MNGCVGFDIGNHAVHIAVEKNGVVARSHTVRVDADLVKNGVITSYDAMADFLGDLRKANKLPSGNAALILPSSLCYCRRFFVASNTKEQLMFNLPYGFRDFITDDKSRYYFDGAILGAVQSEGATAPELDVFAAAVRKEVIDDYVSMFRKAGFKLKTVIPQEFALMNLLRAADCPPHHHGILDIGHNSVKLFLYDGHLFEGVRVIDYGCNALDDIISEKFGVDAYMAATYRESNFNGANDLEECRAVYGSMAVELLKATNFYRFNGGKALEHLHCCGGGTRNAALMDVLKSALQIPLVDTSEFFNDKNANSSVDVPLVVSAAGVALQ